MRGIPVRLWPSWTLRLVPSGGDNHAGALARLRRSASALLLLPGTSITFPGAVAALAPAAVPVAKPVIPPGCPEPVLASVLAQLAWSLDRHGSPIDYERRRRLFTPDTALPDGQALRRLMKAEGLHDDSVVSALRWHLLIALQGEVPDEPPASAVLRNGSGLALLTAPLNRFIRDQAAASLERHDIDEPVSWEPPAHWAGGCTWPGTDIDVIDTQAVRETLAAIPSRKLAKARLPVSRHQVQLLAEARGIVCAGTAPHDPARRRQQPKRVPRTGALSPAQLQASYVAQRASIAEIAALARCDAGTVRRAIGEAGIPLRQRRGPLRGTITREWLHEQYIGQGRSAPDIARELGLHKNTILGLLSRHGISKPADTRASSPFAQLDVQLTPAMLAVSRSRNSLQRLQHVAAMPGQPSIGSAAQHLSISRGTLGGQLSAMERTAGFRIIDRTSPLRATGEGATFLAEARRLFAELDQLT